MLRGLVAIVGRPNVGKSTLFNSITKTDKAIVHNLPGVTRDRLYGELWFDRDAQDGCVVIDTGGFETEKFSNQPFQENLVWQQTRIAIAEADLVLLVVERSSGVHPHDTELVRYLKSQNKPFLVVVNKVDGREQVDSAWEFYGLGVEHLITISAAYRRGLGDLRQAMKDALRESASKQREIQKRQATHIAIIGRPNAGKSSIVNRLTGTRRSVVSNVAGTTRDVVDMAVRYNGDQYVLVDTAGIRRHARIDSKLESWAVLRSIRALERAEVVFVVIDATTGLTDQDARLATLALSKHRPVAIVVNKWDLIREKDAQAAKAYEAAIKRRLGGFDYVPVAFVSCLTNQRIHNLFQIAERLAQTSSKRCDTSQVNDVVQRATRAHSPALFRGHSKRVKFFYATQVDVRPPTFVVFCNYADELQESYKRYLTKALQKDLGFSDIPVKILWRNRQAANVHEDAGRTRVSLS